MQLDVAESGGRYRNCTGAARKDSRRTISHLQYELNASKEPESFFHLETVQAAIYQIDDLAASSESSQTWLCDAHSHSIVTLLLRQIERTISSNVSLRILKSEPQHCDISYSWETGSWETEIWHTGLIMTVLDGSRSTYPAHRTRKRLT